MQIGRVLFMSHFVCLCVLNVFLCPFVFLKLSSPCQRNPPNLQAPSCPRKNLCLQARASCVLQSTPNGLTCLSLHHQPPSKCWCHTLCFHLCLDCSSMLNIRFSIFRVDIFFIKYVYVFKNQREVKIISPAVIL